MIVEYDARRRTVKAADYTRKLKARHGVGINDELEEVFDNMAEGDLQVQLDCDSLCNPCHSFDIVTNKWFLPHDFDWLSMKKCCPRPF
eukprot:1568212-Amphidinium_carterae.1